MVTHPRFLAFSLMLMIDSSSELVRFRRTTKAHFSAKNTLSP